MIPNNPTKAYIAILFAFIALLPATMGNPGVFSDSPSNAFIPSVHYFNTVESKLGITFYKQLSTYIQYVYFLDNLKCSQNNTHYHFGADPKLPAVKQNLINLFTNLHERIDSKYHNEIYNQFYTNARLGKTLFGKFDMAIVNLSGFECNNCQTSTIHEILNPILSFIQQFQTKYAHDMAIQPSYQEKSVHQKSHNFIEQQTVTTYWPLPIDLHYVD
ncbi:MAG: hypothetical protein COZ46_05160 [Verrucomicrobia bacterium CG_4_10_14_3_um_filter_43_23]|nr:MAG: hypothetical protein AUJ82_03910 [Verrucomicrobia bacterium CG1_02_43_26]PIP58494.1 MAG: hypothetical protein COX01_08235 [Verrucomicrobia bacterium CG22_combo_CG10-13_8_21_14_all_43_17]PIX58167.1 MAG: hypothetical protein COZ46_05160 [Verrucomicrobia bacterium CG_4_10_14_3_um_filter_43_23]PIY61147.1 MAG: hypothetical protein COY94_06795 [Verrucomicrobia bacterium CG_4_10_14_0_8_um_filter_43_34]PJA43374.1 MAG: hypothetical protein CO175_08385 [Verrucomicrobia bacterium CG_4_9_14_3_um_fi